MQKVLKMNKAKALERSKLSSHMGDERDECEHPQTSSPASLNTSGEEGTGVSGGPTTSYPRDTQAKAQPRNSGKKTLVQQTPKVRATRPNALGAKLTMWARDEGKTWHTFATPYAMLIREQGKNAEVHWDEVIGMFRTEYPQYPVRTDKAMQSKWVAMAKADKTLPASTNHPKQKTTKSRTAKPKVKKGSDEPASTSAAAATTQQAEISTVELEVTTVTDQVEVGIEPTEHLEEDNPEVAEVIGNQTPVTTPSTSSGCAKQPEQNSFTLVATGASGAFEEREENAILADVPEEREQASQLTEGMRREFKKNLRNAGINRRVRNKPLNRWKPNQSEIETIGELWRVARAKKMEARTSTQALWIAVNMTYQSRPKKERPSEKSLRRFQSTKAEVTNLRRKIGRITEAINRANTKPAGSCGPLTKLETEIAVLTRKQKPSLTDLEEIKTRVSERLQRISRLSTHLKRTYKIQSAREKYDRAPGLRAIQECNNKHPLDPAEVKSFYSDLLGTEAVFDNQHPIIKDWTESLKATPPKMLENAELRTLAHAKFQTALKTCKNWSSPGPDGVQAFWWKTIPEARDWLREYIKEMCCGDYNWDPEQSMGRTVLLPKGGDATNVSNYRPITCLNNSFKLMTATVAKIAEQNIRDSAQFKYDNRALQAGEWGCIDATMVDQAISSAANTEQLHVAWIDIAKAFDSIPHAMIQTVTENMAFPPTVKNLINKTMRHWVTNIEVPLARGFERVEITYKRGIFQGDSLSPLLFTLALYTLSHSLNKRAKTAINGTRITLPNHQLYADDLKLYATNAERLDTLLETTKSAIEALGMSMSMQKSNRDHTEAIVRDLNFAGVPRLEPDKEYKYLGIQQRARQDNNRTLEKAQAKLIAVAKTIFTSKLATNQQMDLYNKQVPSVLRYLLRCGVSAPSLAGTIHRARIMDRDIRSMMRYTEGTFRAKTNIVERLYLSKRYGGLGLGSLEYEVYKAAMARAAYLTLGPRRIQRLKPIFEDPKLTRKGDRIISVAKEACERLGITSVAWGAGQIVINAKTYTSLKQATMRLTELVKTKETSLRMLAMKEYKMASRFLDNKDVDLPALGRTVGGRYAPSTLRWVTNIQESTVMCRMHPARRKQITAQPWVNNVQPGVLCTQCPPGTKRWPETVDHITNGCAKYEYTSYLRSHDDICLKTYNLVMKHFTQGEDQMFYANPPTRKTFPAGEGEHAEILYWNYMWECDILTHHCRPDITYISHLKKEIWVLEIAVSLPTKMKERQTAKFERYSKGRDPNEQLASGTMGLVANLQDRYKEYTIEVVPIIVGATGETLVDWWPRKFLKQKGLSNAEIEKYRMAITQTAAIWSARIVNRHLAQQ